MGLKEKFTSFFFLEDENQMDDKEEQNNSSKVKPTPNYNQKSMQKSTTDSANKPKNGGLNVVSINQQKSSQKPKITLVEPRLYSEVKDVADLVLANQSVILNFRRMDQDQARQMIDFLMGVSYAIKGDIQRIGDQIFVCTPENVEFDGKELNAMKGQEF